jgi:hypothetical protein
MSPQIDFLYSLENQADYDASCQEIFSQYAPQSEAEAQLVSHIAVATWLRRRYAGTMHYALRQLELARQTPGTPEFTVVQLTRNLVRFNREYRAQRKHISGCRAALKRMRLENGIPNAHALPEMEDGSDCFAQYDALDFPHAA